MNNIIPFISSEPPPIQNDGFEHDSYDSEIFHSYKIDDNIVPEESMEVDLYTEPNIQTNCEFYDYQNFGRENDLSETRNPVELCQHIEKIVQENNLRVDFTDSANLESNQDCLSEHSLDGEFDDYIDSIYCNKECIIKEIVVDQEFISTHNGISNDASFVNKEVPMTLPTSKPPINEDISDDFVKISHDLKIDDFGDFPPVEEDFQIDYFSNRTDDSKVLPDEFADFTFANYPELSNNVRKVSQEETDLTEQKTVGISNDDDDFDDFDDFATFENTTEHETCDKSTNEEDQVENLNLNILLENLLTTCGSMESDLIYSKNFDGLSHIIRPDSFISNQRLFDDSGLALWKELTNYDYSPAFIFQWMQSATYERFMTSIGPEYKDMLSSHRATLPLYSVNLTPIEPTPVENCLQVNNSASNSSIDLTSKDESATIGVPDKNCGIDFKNLEEEFIFNQFSTFDGKSQPTDMADTNPASSLSNYSSTVVQSTDRFGGIFKSFLKPLNQTKTSSISKPVNPQAEAVLKELPDLSYMSSKVLMFPVISTCDVEDNI